MNIVVVELRGELVASLNPSRIVLDDLNAQYPIGTIFVRRDKSTQWQVVNRGSPVANTRFNSRAKLFDYPANYLPEIVKMAAMLVD